MLTAALADINTQVDHLTHGELHRQPLSAQPMTSGGEDLSATPMPASTPPPGITLLKCLPNPPAGHERQGCPLHSTTQWISTYPPHLFP